MQKENPSNTPEKYENPVGCPAIDEQISVRCPGSSLLLQFWHMHTAAEMDILSFILSGRHRRKCRERMPGSSPLKLIVP